MARMYYAGYCIIGICMAIAGWLFQSGNKEDSRYSHDV
jgi:hypothetical protein